MSDFRSVVRVEGARGIFALYDWLLFGMVRSASLRRSLGILFGRVVLGVVFVGHGVQNFRSPSLGVSDPDFPRIGVAHPPMTAPAAAIEIGGGVLLILGVLTAAVSVLLALTMGGSLLFAYLPNGVFAPVSGWRLITVLGISSLVFAVIGAGRFGLDGILLRRLKKAPIENYPVDSSCSP